MKIVVLAGGLSPERNVSLSSGVMVAEALRGRGHKAALVDILAWRMMGRPWRTALTPLFPMRGSTWTGTPLT